MLKLVSTPELARILGKSPRTIEKERLEGTGIPFVKLGRTVRYDLRDVEEHIRRNRRTSTSDPGPESG